MSLQVPGTYLIITKKNKHSNSEEYIKNMGESMGDYTKKSKNI